MKILLDTNLLIYREDHSIVDKKVLELTKILYDSSKYKIVVHPLTFEDLSHIKNVKEREIINSKIKIYEKIENPPKVSDSFNKLVGCTKIPNDLIDNSLLFAVYRNCVSYLITNDNKLKSKAKKINLESKVLGIEEAIKFFKPLEEKEIRTPAFIKSEYLYNIDLNDTFFDSLKEDYKKFENWYKKKTLEGKKAYISRDENNCITSFLMLKLENKDEDYADFKEPLKKDIRLKISTFKVSCIGKRIGECYIKIILDEAIKNNVKEIYITVFRKQERLINLLFEYGFKQKTTKKTEKSDSSIEEELVLLKDMNDNTYPNFDLENRNVFIVPIKQKYHEKLFPESEINNQISLEELLGKNTFSNSIKKAYICKSSNKKIQKGDVLLFYASEYKRSITTIGIVDNVFTEFSSPEELFNLARKRTVYSLEEIEKEFDTRTKLILFKYYKSLSKPIKYDKLIEKEILKYPPISIVQVDVNKIKKILSC